MSERNAFSDTSRAQVSKLTLRRENGVSREKDESNVPKRCLVQSSIGPSERSISVVTRISLEKPGQRTETKRDGPLRGFEKFADHLRSCPHLVRLVRHGGRSRSGGLRWRSKDRVLMKIRQLRRQQTRPTCDSPLVPAGSCLIVWVGLWVTVEAIQSKRQFRSAAEQIALRTARGSLEGSTHHLELRRAVPACARARRWHGRAERKGRGRRKGETRAESRGS